MHLSTHVVEVGQKLTGSAPEPGPDTCGGGFTGTPVTWLWDNFPGLTLKRGCGDTGTSCTFKATSATGSPGSRYVAGCIDGDSGQGTWLSCDYYAVLPKCKGHRRWRFTTGGYRARRSSTSWATTGTHRTAGP